MVQGGDAVKPEQRGMVRRKHMQRAGCCHQVADDQDLGTALPAFWAMRATASGSEIANEGLTATVLVRPR